MCAIMFVRLWGIVDPWKRKKIGGDGLVREWVWERRRRALHVAVRPLLPPVCIQRLMIGDDASGLRALLPKGQRFMQHKDGSGVPCTGMVGEGRARSNPSGRASRNSAPNATRKDRIDCGRHGPLAYGQDPRGSRQDLHVAASMQTNRPLWSTSWNSGRKAVAGGRMQFSCLSLLSGMPTRPS